MQNGAPTFKMDSREEAHHDFPEEEVAGRVSVASTSGPAVTDSNTPLHLLQPAYRGTYGELTPEQRKLPIRGVWNDTLLVERIEADGYPLVFQ